MKKEVLVFTVLAAAFAVQSAGAVTLEEILKEKGVITEADYKEVTKSKPIDYKIGKGFTLTSADEKFKLEIGGRLQSRYTFTDADHKGDTNKFEVKRMKFWMSGNAYTKDLTYLFQVDFANSGKAQMFEHGYLNYRLLNEVQVLAGQTKVPFGRQWLNSSGGQQFVDRSTASDMFRPGYDAGVKLHGDVAGGIATYELGVYGGGGQSNYRTSSDNAYAARVTVNPFGKMAYSESDLEQSAKPLLSMGANYYRNTLQKNATVPANTLTLAPVIESNSVTLAGANGWLGRALPSTFTNGEKIDINGYGVDAAFKWMGASVQAEYLLGQADGQSSDKTLRAQGFYAQAGYFIIPKKMELALRYSFVDPNRDIANDQQVDTQGAVSYYFDKHNLKLQGDVTNSHIQHLTGPTDDMIYRVQAQIIF